MFAASTEGTGDTSNLNLKGVRAYMQQSRIFVGMVLILIFGEVLGLYGYVRPSPLAQRPHVLTWMQLDCVSHSQHQSSRLDVLRDFLLKGPRRLQAEWYCRLVASAWLEVGLRQLRLHIEGRSLHHT